MHEISTQNLPNISGWQHSDVLTILRGIQNTGAVPNGVRLGLIIEGGALRGVVSCGYAIALSEVARHDAFAAIYGASSGALNGVYFASESLDKAFDIYVENATDPMCTNIWNFPNILDVDWLVDNWMFGPRQFDLNKLHNASSEVTIVLTRLDTGAAFYFDAKRATIPVLRQAMKATSYAPLLTEKSQVIGGIAYGDGAISDTFPVRRAIAQGATHIICLSTRPKVYRKHIGDIERIIHRIRLIKHSNMFIDAYFRRLNEYNRSLDILYKGGAEAVPTLVIHPKDKTEHPRNTDNNSEIVRRLGTLAVHNARTQLRTALTN